MRKAVWFISLILTSSIFAGTTGKIAGLLKDAKTGEKLLGANVLIENTALGGASGTDGTFFIINVPPGSYNVRATMMGYKTTTVSDVRVKIDQTTEVNFAMQEEAIKGEQVTIVAQKPKVEIDLTASKQTATRDDIERSWGTDVKQVISDLPGVNVNGGIRGGFNLDVAYRLDGMDMRDVGSNTNFTGINLSTIQELEVLTGGWNAEYGQANGAIINVVTKNAGDRIHGVASYKMRPNGKYHWGRNIYDPDDIFHTVMTTPEFWDTGKKWSTGWMAPAETYTDSDADGVWDSNEIYTDTNGNGKYDPAEMKPGYNGGSAPFTKWTAQQRADWWKAFINDKSINPQIDYADRMEWESEFTLYGPLSKKLGFMLSGRYRDGVPIYPSSLRYNPDMTFHGSLTYKISGQTKVDVTGVYTQFKNSGAPRTNFMSTEDTNHDDQGLPFIVDPYSRFSYWLWGATSSSNSQVRAPEYASMYNFQTKLTHVFNPKTYLEVAFQHAAMQYKMDYRGILKSRMYGPDGKPVPAAIEPAGFVSPDGGVATVLPRAFVNYHWGYPGDVWFNDISSNNNTLKADLTSQITRHHQLKTGLLFSYQMFDKILHDHQSSGALYYAHVTDLAPTKTHPYEGAVYVQDKMEFEGMVINAGLRMDFFNGNKNVSANVFDPLMISDSTAGHVGPVGYISWNPDGSGSGYKKTPTQVAISPRFGISHPISENTVLHFTFGQFYQRPPWQKIIGPTVVRTFPPSTGIDSRWIMNSDSQTVWYNFYTHYVANPGLTWEKMTQYEVGFEQNIADRFSLDVTLYYKDAKDLTSSGIQRGPANLNFTSSGGAVFARMYGNYPPYKGEDRIPGVTQGYFQTVVNGAWADVRGIEASFGTKFRYFNFTLDYNMSFLNTGNHYLNEIYKDWSGGKTGSDQYRGANNTDNGFNGTDDDAWNPHHTARVRFSLVTPRQFGPAIRGIRPFGRWSISTSTTWVDGGVFTYHAVDDPSTLPNNRKWKDRWSTHMNVSKTVRVADFVDAKFYAQIQNVFNQKHLRLLSGDAAMREYFEKGILPYDTTTKEPLVWDWYSNNPREIYFGVSMEF